MPRILSALVVAALLGAVFLLPRANPARLAALRAAELVAEHPVAGAEGEPTSAAHELFGSSAFEATGEGRGKLRLTGARFRAEGLGEWNAQIHAELRDAIARGLLTAAQEEGLEVELVGQQMPVPGGANFLLTARPDSLELLVETPGGAPLTVTADWRPAQRSSVLPSLVAIALALAFRRPVLALFCGVFAAAILLRLGSGGGPLDIALGGLADVFRTFFWNEFRDGDRIQIIWFVVAMLAMVGVITRSGGIHGVMNAVARLARGVRRTQLATWLMGIAVFFDDYANTILVGSTMRPLTDRFRISREKLAYLVDSTAAPVAGISILSTWIAFEVSTFSAQLPAAGMASSAGYQVFIETLPYRFYCILTLAFVGMVAITGRDFGPMLRAERRARTTGALVRPGGKPMVGRRATSMDAAPGVTPRAHRAVVPLVAFIAVTLWWILRSGGAFERSTAELLTLRGISDVLGSSDSYGALAWGSTTGLVLGALLAWAAGLRSEIANAAWTTLRSMGIAIVILYLAWMIGSGSKELGTASYLTVSLETVLHPFLLPLLLFVLSGAVSFATGSSWGTMSILLPLVVGLAFGLGEKVPELGGHALMILSIGAVLEGSIFGDHCSPLSDTTVLSSVASASDHVDHVRTQAPYALLTMIVAMCVGYLPCTALGWSPWWSLLLALAVLFAALRILGERVDEPLPATAPTGAAATEPLTPAEPEA